MIDYYAQTPISIYTYFSSRIMADQVGFVVIVLALVTLMFLLPSASAKPKLCPCVINVTTATADCHYKYDFRQLKEIPNCVPNTTRELIFHGNNLTYRRGQLQRFALLTYLDLSQNLKFTPGCDSFDGLMRLKSLNLSSTNLEHLKSCVSSKLNNLETLRLSESRMRYIDVDFFENLNRLNVLDLADNSLSEISNNIFTGLPNLKHLDLGYNFDIVFNIHSFFGLSKLESLLLDFGMVPNATSFPISIFRPLTQIEEISLLGLCSTLYGYYNCEAIDQRLRVISTLKILTVDNFVINLLGQGFASLTHLKELNFGTFIDLPSSCNVTSLSNKTFQSLRNLPISKLTIKWCQINQIMPFTFSMFRNLTYLDLFNIKVGQVSRDEEIEIGLQQSNIQHLRLRLQDQIGLAPFPLLSGLVSSQLQTLDIDSSPVYWIRWAFFQELPVSLQHLHLTNNQIIIVCFCDLFRLENLKVLDLSHQDNRMDLKQDHILCRLPKNETEHVNDVASNHSEANVMAKTIDCSVCQKLPVSLRTIDISHSKLLCDVVKVLCDPSNKLKYLDISYQSNKDCFETFWKVTKNLLSLEHLNAAKSALKIIPSYAFSQLSRLKNLTLHHNYIAIADFDLQTQFLEYLDLSYNNILYLSQKLTDQLNSIAKQSNLVIFLEGNQLICDCERM